MLNVIKDRLDDIEYLAKQIHNLSDKINVNKIKYETKEKLDLFDIINKPIEISNDLIKSIGVKKKDKIKLNINELLKKTCDDILELCQNHLNENSKIVMNLCCCNCFKILDTSYTLFPCGHVVCQSCFDVLNI